MAARAKALNEMRMIHTAFLITIFLFIFVVQMSSFAENSVSRSTEIAIACAAIADIGVGFALRKQYLNRAERAVAVEGDSEKAMRIWRLANLVSFAHAETVALFGFALKFLGASWKLAGPFFLVGFALLLLWTPRLDLPLSASAPQPPIPPPTGTD